MTRDPLDPREMTAVERDGEIARLFAAAVLRLLSSRRQSTPHLAPHCVVTSPLSKSRKEVDSSPEESLDGG